MQKVSDFYPWNEESSISGQFLTCYDNNSGSGEFSFVYTLLKLLKEGGGIDLICCNHDRIHYESILRKNNLDLNRLEGSGRVSVTILSPPSTAQFVKNSIAFDELISKFNDQRQQQSMGDQDSQNQTNNVALMIDDIDAFELLAPTPLAARQFFANALQAMSNKNHITSVVAFGRLPLDTMTQFTSLSESDHMSSRYKFPTGQNALGASRYNYPLDEDDSQPSLAEYLRYRSTICVIVSALESGYSSAIHGLITVTQPSRAVKRQVLQYKALDSGVMCSLVGDTKLQ